MSNVTRLRPAIGPMIFREFMDEGIPIFPLYRFKAGKCECGDPDCEAVGKHPRASNWQHSPLWDDEQIEAGEMAGLYDTGYGVLCRGLIVIDVDARNGGIESYRKLLDVIPEIAGAGLAVHTGSGGGSQHLYFRAPADTAFVSHLADYPGIDFKSSGYVVGPGSAHKSGGVYTCDGSPSDIGAAPAALIALLVQPERHRSEYQGHSVDMGHSEIGDMLGHIGNVDLDYDQWLSIGMAVHHATQGTGYDLWSAWSATSAKHDDTHMEKKWHSFGRSANPVTLGTLIHHAEAGGWVMPVDFTPDQKFNDEDDRGDGLPFDISGVDLTAPPGFVGDIARWIEAQSFRPRKHLAVAGALTAMGNIAGLRYVDDLTSVTTNLFTFCVAGSGTGKDNIQKAVVRLHKAAGIAAATHGGIKSEQEITRNLIRHQAAFYIVDEFGILLQRIKNAQKRGGAPYLEGIIGMLMNAYSSARSLMLLNGDTKEDVRVMLTKELNVLLNADDQNDYVKRRTEGVEQALTRLDDGLERPFLSLMGCTTPVTFNDLVDHETATNGFMRRSLIFNERETAPPTKDDFVQEPMSQDMSNYVAAIFSGGEYDSMTLGRVENYDERTIVPTTAKAVAMLRQAAKWLEGQAEAYKVKGLEALPLGAYELVSKVALILAVPERIRTEEHVRWAFALIKRDIEEKVRLVIGNETHKAFRPDALDARILNLVDENGEKEGVIVNRIMRAGFGKEDILSALSKLTAASRLTCAETTHPTNKRVSRRYSAR